VLEMKLLLLLLFVGCAPTHLIPAYSPIQTPRMVQLYQDVYRYDTCIIVDTVNGYFKMRCK